MTRVLGIVFLCLITLSATTNCSIRARAPERHHPRELGALGKKLFFDKRLSGTNTMSCATCHQPERAFTNGLKVATGVHGDPGDRNVPTLLNRAGSKIQFWDGRAKSLEDQALVVITADHEMGASLPNVLEKLEADPVYAREFRRLFGSQTIEPPHIAHALAAYERTLQAGEAPYDRFLAGDREALSAAQVRGMKAFFNDFKCASCHKGSNFTDERMRPRCYPATNNLNQLVPIQITEDKLVKTPTLRNLNFTGPYMHNGFLDTLDEVVEFYTPSFQVDDRGLPDTARPVVHISPEQRKDLVAFLKSLSADKPFHEAAE